MPSLAYLVQKRCDHQDQFDLALFGGFFVLKLDTDAVGLLVLFPIQKT